jgi:hypothetical protein
MMFGELVAERSLGNINIELYRGDAYFVMVSVQTAPNYHVLVSQQILGDDEADVLREELERGAVHLN